MVHLQKRITYREAVRKLQQFGRFNPKSLDCSIRLFSLDDEHAETIFGYPVISLGRLGLVDNSGAP
jgi:hypothetical protein